MKKNDFINNDGDLIIKIDDKYLNKNKFINKWVVAALVQQRINIQ